MRKIRTITSIAIGAIGTIAFTGCLSPQISGVSKQINFTSNLPQTNLIHSSVDGPTSSPSSTPSPAPSSVLNEELSFQSSCSVLTSTDWSSQLPIDSSSSSAIANPRDCQIVVQSPPDFRWPDRLHQINSTGNYTFTLKYPSGVSRTKTVLTNWIIWDEVLPPGSYEWSVNYHQIGASVPVEAMHRRFYVSSSAHPYLIGTATDIVNKVLAKPHPRAFPSGDEATSIIAAFSGARSAYFQGLKNMITSWSAAAVLGDPTSGTAATQYAANRWQFQDECAILTYESLMYPVSSTPALLAEIKRRVEMFASWSPTGQSSNANDDQLNRCVAHSMALAYDLAYKDLPVSTKQLVLPQIETRLQQMSMDLTMLYDSHGNTILQYLVAASASIAGDSSIATSILQTYAPFYGQYVCPWGGEDGGFANGLDYAVWNATLTFPLNDFIRWAGGPDVNQKAWFRNFGNYIVYMTPPGAPNEAHIPRNYFGDGASTSAYAYEFMNQMYFSRAKDNPLYRWYSSQMNLSDNLQSYWQDTEAGFLAPSYGDLSGIPFPANTPNAKLFPSIGWVAMHSDLSNKDRNSIYFKSSVYGSYNHSFSDQNSFVVHSKQKNLTVNSGYYDSYSSPHEQAWAKRTKSKNAITVDGGQGQFDSAPSGSIQARGKITQFSTTSGVDITTGDATDAYSGLLTKAVRSIVYLRPNTILVFDSLASNTARTWEWNIHAINPFTITDANSAITVTNAPASMCVKIQGTTPMSFAQNNVYPVDPTGDFINISHGRFSSTTKTTAASYVTVMTIDCSPIPDLQIQQTSSGWSVLANGQNVVFDGTTAAVH